jgi:serine acetyltransferase
VVTRDVPDYAIVAGVPAKVVDDVRDREDLPIPGGDDIGTQRQRDAPVWAHRQVGRA